MLSLCGVVPERSSDPAEVASLVARTGAAILTGWDVSEEGAQRAAMAVLGDRVLAVPPPAAVVEGGEKDLHRFTRGDRLPPHTDGFAYGDHSCDYFLLACVRQGTSGGESYLVDSLRLLPLLDPELAGFLTDHPVDQTEPGMHPTASPLAIVTARGRLAVRAVPFVRPLPEAKNPERVIRLVDQWRQVCEEAAAAAPRFTLNAGEVVCIDNYRLMHGRDPFEGDRFLWRVWVWTADGNGLPAGVLHSDSRYAHVALPASA